MDVNKLENDKLFKIYPNPTSDVINIQVKNGIYTIMISDIYGKIIFKGSNTKQFKFENFAEGNYIVKIINNEGTSINSKIIYVK